MNRPINGSRPSTSKGATNISEGTMQAVRRLSTTLGLPYTDEQLLAFVKAIEAGADPVKLVHIINEKRRI
ncbi:hypothetical protein PMAYCL1PPCAC_23106 [Pristionchus mayeri]|uniref:Uncharacterized protein n=1 Tax=Pristionchus mayeri TaxID=1317129 RepID=A0AAN5CXG3_9BILA|nr:hypothetical protein PMAYCL1PPCAC_23106 [Pristionchus mayeri]